MLAREMDIENGLDFLTITLPSRRKLYYAKPSLGENSWGRPSILYYGVNQTTKQWTQLETYGGKLVETAFRPSPETALQSPSSGWRPPGSGGVPHPPTKWWWTVPAEKADLDEVVRLMSLPIPGAPDLPLNADGWVGDFFRKDYAMFVHKNAEGYPDPTVGEAMSNIAQEERRKEADRLAAISALIPVMKGCAELVGLRSWAGSSSWTRKLARNTGRRKEVGANGQ